MELKLEKPNTMQYTLERENDRFCEKCNSVSCKMRQDAYAKQHILNIIFMCIAVGTIIINVILIGHVVSKSNEVKLLEQNIVRLEIQVKELQHARTHNGKTPNKDNEFEDRIQTLVQNRMKRRTKRNNVKKPRKKKASTPKEAFYVHVEGLDGQHMPEDRFAGVFQKWMLSSLTEFKPRGKHTVATNNREFQLDMDTGELTIFKKGIYMFYAQITLMGTPNQGYFVERKSEGFHKDWERMASCFMTFDTTPSVIHNNYEKNFSCPTMRLIKFNRNDKLRIRHENKTNVMANFEAWASYFGMYKLK